MVKLMILGRRAPGRTRAAAHAHLRDVHGRLVLCAPPDAGAMPCAYVQNHVFDGAYPATDGPLSIERDLVTEIWFDSIDHMRASVATPHYLANLRPDEPRFVDDATVIRLLVRVTPLREGEAGPFKAFVAMTGGAAEAIGARVLDAPGLLSLVRNDVLPPPDGAPRLIDTVFEGWFAERDAATAVVDSVRDLLAAADGGPLSCFAMAGEEFDTARLLAGYGRSATPD